jgi:hypothetical protein
VSEPPNLSRMRKDEAVEAIKDWFLHNFEDPVENTPYESAEGGYQFIWGGPYDTRDIIETVFHERTSRTAIEEAIRDLEESNSEWVPSSSRLQPPDDIPYEPDESEPSQTELYGLMQDRIRELEEALERAPEAPSGMGHNKPPEPLDIEPLDAGDRKEVSNALNVLKMQRINPPDNGNAAEGALEKISTKREKLGKWLLQQGEVFTSEAVKEAGKQFGKWAPAAFWIWAIDRMLHLESLTSSWIASLRTPF